MKKVSSNASSPPVGISTTSEAALVNEPSEERSASEAAVPSIVFE